MKKSFLLLMALAFSTVAFAQEKKTVKFTKVEQQQIQKILGKEFTAVLGKDGQLGAVTPSKVGQLISTPKGGFKDTPSLSANAIAFAYEKLWVYKQSGELLKSRLGEERFNQLGQILAKKGLR